MALTGHGAQEAPLCISTRSEVKSAIPFNHLRHRDIRAAVGEIGPSDALRLDGGLRLGLVLEALLLRAVSRHRVLAALPLGVGPRALSLIHI